MVFDAQRGAGMVHDRRQQGCMPSRRVRMRAETPRDLVDVDVVSGHARWFARSFGRADYPALTTEDLHAVAAVFDPISFEPGTIVFRAGDPATGVYVVREGTVYLRSGQADPGHLLARTGAGSALGDGEALMGVTTYEATAQAYNRVSALRAASVHFAGLLAARPRVALRWLGATLRSRDAARGRIEQLLGGSVGARLCGALVELADDHGYVHQTHEALAELIGARRETVSRGMARLRSRRVIDNTSAGVVLLDRELAAAIAVAVDRE
jgi:CRP-like cAMP-binding protein